MRPRPRRSARRQQRGHAAAALALCLAGWLGCAPPARPAPPQHTLRPPALAPHTPLAPFTAELERSVSGAPAARGRRTVTLRVTPRQPLRGDFEVVALGVGQGVVSRLPPSGGRLDWTLPATAQVFVAVSWRDPRGAMGASALLSNSPRVPQGHEASATAPRFQPLLRPIGAIGAAIPLGTRRE